MTKNQLLILGIITIGSFSLCHAKSQKNDNMVADARQRLESILQENSGARPETVNQAKLELAAMDIDGRGIEHPNYTRARQLLESILQENRGVRPETSNQAKLELAWLEIHGLGSDKPNHGRAKQLLSQVSKPGSGATPEDLNRVNLDLAVMGIKK